MGKPKYMVGEEVWIIWPWDKYYNLGKHVISKYIAAKDSVEVVGLLGDHPASLFYRTEDDAKRALIRLALEST